MLEKHSLLAVPHTGSVEQDVLYCTTQVCPLASGQAETYEVSVLRKVLTTLRTTFTNSVQFFLT